MSELVAVKTVKNDAAGNQKHMNVQNYVSSVFSNEEKE